MRSQEGLGCARQTKSEDLSFRSWSGPETTATVWRCCRIYFLRMRKACSRGSEFSHHDANRWMFLCAMDRSIEHHDRDVTQTRVFQCERMAGVGRTGGLRCAIAVLAVGEGVRTTVEA